LSQKIVVATRNPGKLAEIRAELWDLGLRFEALSDFPQVGDLPETGQTFEENALQKAEACHRATGLPALADDSGLEIDFLDGVPGVHSSRFGGEGATDEDRNRLVLDLMKDAGPAERTARFRCVMALAGLTSAVLVAEGTCEGEIAYAPRGEHGFGYDPIFLLPERGVTMAELTQEEKNRISHRGQALRALRALLVGLDLNREGHRAC
jgi:XTP/dITP diphosphohydrolase